jgi:tetratricopeptide (TPR) repeat protein
MMAPNPMPISNPTANVITAADEPETNTSSPPCAVPETPVRLSQCDLLWRLQREFYQKQGAEAWRQSVPWYITNNPHIANACAEVIVRVLQDLKRLGAYRSLEPVYIVECGGGVGLFAFYVLNRLARRLRELQLEQMELVYVMVDVSEKNVAFLEGHPALAPFAHSGLLDFAIWDLETELDLTLRRRGRTLRAADATTHTANPVILLANYVFDSLRHDVFRVADNQLQEGLVSLRPAPMTAAADGVPAEAVEAATPRLSQLQTEYEFRPASLPYFDNPRLDAILEHYSRTVDGNTFLFPIGPLRCIEAWRKLSRERLIVLSTDKASCRPIEFSGHGTPALVMHDECFSLTTNFHALGLYFLEADGFVRHQASQQAIASSLFGVGLDIRQCVETAAAFESAIDTFGPGNLFSIYRSLEQACTSMPIEVIVAHLRLLQYDPVVMDFCMPVILQRIKQAEAVVIRDLIDIMHRTAANFYNFPGRSDTLSCVGIFFQELGDLPTALHYYEKSLEYFGPNPVAFYNSGLCRHRLNQPKEALEAFRSVLDRVPDHIMARGWIHQITEALAKITDVENPAPRGHPASLQGTG